MTTDTKSGIFLLLFGVAIVSIQDVLMKFLSGSLPIHEILVVRYAMALLLFGWLVAFVGDIGKIRTKNLRLQILRGFLAFAAGITYYLALAVLPIAEIVALYFSAPLFVTILGALFFKDKVGWYRWGAVAVGFLGMLIMIRPGSGVFSAMAFLAIFSAILYALSLLLIRHAGEGESAIALSFYAMVTNLFGNVVVAAGFAWGWFSSISFPSTLDFLTRAWVVPTNTQLALILCIALITVLAFYSITQAYRIAAPSLLSVFEYTALFWGLTWGILIWQDYPDAISMVGIALMVGAGLFTIIRESGVNFPTTKWFTGRALSRFR